MAEKRTLFYGAGPVSYTHLDVYKRQPLSLSQTLYSHTAQSPHILLKNYTNVKSKQKLIL